MYYRRPVRPGRCPKCRARRVLLQTPKGPRCEDCVEDSRFGGPLAMIATAVLFMFLFCLFFISLVLLVMGR